MAVSHMIDGPAIYWTVEEAAAILRKAPETIRRQLRAGTLPGGKIGTWFVRGDLIAERTQGRAS